MSQPSVWLSSVSSLIIDMLKHNYNDSEDDNHDNCSLFSNICFRCSFHHVWNNIPESSKTFHNEYLCRLIICFRLLKLEALLISNGSIEFTLLSSANLNRIHSTTVLTEIWCKGFCQSSRSNYACSRCILGRFLEVMYGAPSLKHRSWGP